MEFKKIRYLANLGHFFTKNPVHGLKSYFSGRNFASVRNTGLKEVCFQTRSESEVPSQDDKGPVEGSDNSGGVWKQTLLLHEEPASFVFESRYLLSSWLASYKVVMSSEKLFVKSDLNTQRKKLASEAVSKLTFLGLNISTKGAFTLSVESPNTI